MLAIIVIILFFGLIGVMGYVVYRQLQKTDPAKMDTSVQDNISSAQEFLPFEDIRDQMILLGAHRYRAVIECSSTNYNLKTDGEKVIIESSFQRFINSLSFPITFYIQTKVIDNSKMLESLKDEIETSMKVFPQLKEYGNLYFNEMAGLSSYIGNNKQKKKYIIVPYDEAVSLTDLSDSEKYEFSANELRNRASILVEGLNSVGVKARILETKDLAELVFSSYHKDNYTHVENIVNGEFLTLLTQGENNHLENMTEDARLDWILYEAQMRIQTELLNAQVPDFMKKTFDDSIRELEVLRDKTSGYYKQRDVAYNQSTDLIDNEGNNSANSIQE
ncbi:hypothetical protein [Paenibacillus polymyxa]|uniref:hypothetical protein n=1 Tax=Paenibacillus polymyxa TaxID=1406 RepID=UPI0001E6CD5B|nr:hypothetical protein [Paenibacillus polymyxa]WPQ59614.1 hypothetical protein SKN87_28550 [Paenibacillus polymyxa]